MITRSHEVCKACRISLQRSKQLQQHLWPQSTDLSKVSSRLLISIATFIPTAALMVLQRGRAAEKVLKTIRAPWTFQAPQTRSKTLKMRLRAVTVTQSLAGAREGIKHQKRRQHLPRKQPSRNASAAAKNLQELSDGNAYSLLDP